MDNRKISPIRHQTKTQMLSVQLAKLAYQLGPDARLPTMRELCESFGVSGMTMNRALSELEAQGVLTRRQGSGTYVSPQNKQRTVALVYDRNIFAIGASPFSRLLVEEARRRADEHSEKFSFFLADPADHGAVHEDLGEAVVSRRITGVLFAGEQNPAAVEWLEERVPLVALSYLPTAKHRVQIDHTQIVRAGVDALAAQGCKKIGLWIPSGVGIGRSKGKKSFPELDAFRAGLKAHGLTYNQDLVWRLEDLNDTVKPSARETNQEKGLRAAREVFSPESGLPESAVPDGIVINDDMMTRGALTVLTQMGVKIGSDVRIASHTNRDSDILQGYEDKLTLLEIVPSEIVSVMFSQLESLMDGLPAAPVVLIGPHLK